MVKTYPSFTDGTEACLLNKSDLSWFDFVVNQKRVSTLCASILT